MIFTIKVTTRGRFTVPKKLRELFGWNGGNKLKFDVSKSGEVIITSE